MKVCGAVTVYDPETDINEDISDGTLDSNYLVTVQSVDLASMTRYTHLSSEQDTTSTFEKNSHSVYLNTDILPI